MTKPKIYIACPYSKGDVAKNVKTACDMFDRLHLHGYVPFNPLWSHFQHFAHPLPYDAWLAYDLEWLPLCDAVLRLEGESNGADIEVAKATELGIPVFYSIADLDKHFNVNQWW